MATPEEEALRSKIATLENAAEAMSRALRDPATASVGLRNQLNATTNELRKLRAAADVSQEYNELAQRVKNGSISFAGLSSELGSLRDRQQKNGIQLDSTTAALQKSLVIQNLFNQSLQALGTAALQVAKTMFESDQAIKREFLRNVSDGANVMAGLNQAIFEQQQAFERTAKYTDAAGTAIQTIGAGLLLVNPILGGIAIAGGTLLKYFNEFNLQMSKAALDILNDQSKKLITSFGQLTKAGGIFATGYEGLTEQSNIARLTFDQFTKTLVNNRENFILFGGTVAEGGKRFSKIMSNMTEQQRRDLLKIGVTTEDLADATASYTAQLALAGKLRGREDKDVADGAREYAKNLKIISAITGEDAKAAQKRALEASTQTAVQAKLNNMGGDATEKFGLAIAGMDPLMKKAAQQMLYFGTVIDEDARIALSQAPAMEEYLRNVIGQVGDATVKAEGFSKVIENEKNKFGPAIREQVLAAGDGIGAANLALGKYAGPEQFLEYFSKFGLAGKTASENAGEFTTASAAASKAMTEGTSKLTDSIATMTQAMQEAAVKIQAEAVVHMPRLIDNMIKNIDAMTAEAIRILQQKFGSEAAAAARVVPEPAPDAARQAIERGTRPGTEITREMEEAQAARMRLEEFYRQRNQRRLERQQQQQDQNMPGRADGGLTAGPTVAGERGTEAVIPLKGGAIPLKVDLSELVSVMRDQVALTREVLDSIESSNSTQEKILQASY